MAEIPVERKEGGSFPWWLIPLVLLLLLLPLLYFCSKSNVVDNTNSNGNRTNAGNANFGNRVRVSNTGDGAVVANSVGNSNAGNVAVVVNNNDAAVNANGTARNGAAVKDVNEFGSATDKSALLGRGLFVNGVRVNRVLSDKVFTVKSGSDEMFVLLDDNLDSPGGKEKQIRMKPGQNVNLGGEFRAVPTAEAANETRGGGLNNKEYAQMKGQKVYLHANSVEDVK